MASGAATLWRDRNVALLVGGTTINEIGDWLLELAIPVYVFVETGSGIATAAVYLVRLAMSVVFGPLGGSLVDRWDLRTTLVATNLLQAAALTPLLLVDADRLWLVYLVVAFQGLISSVNDPASFALLPKLVEGDRLVRANSALSAGGSIARLVGAATGGIAVATGGLSAVVVADACTFLVAATALWFLRPPRVVESSSPPDADEPRSSSVRAGLQVLRGRPEIGALIGIQCVAMLAFGAFPVIFIAFVGDHLDGGGTEVGLIRASSAFGGLVAAATIGGLATRLQPARVMVAGYVSFAVVGYLFVNAPSFTTALWVYLVLFALTGFPNVASQVGTTSTAQVVCPPDVLGRLGGLMSSTGALGFGVGAVVAGLLLDTISARTLFNAQTSLMLVCGLIGYVFVVRRQAGSVS